MCLKWCIVIWEKQALSCHLHVLAMEYIVCRMRLCCISEHSNPSTTTNYFYSATGLSQSAAWHTVHESQLYAVLSTANRNFAARKQTSLSLVLAMGASHYCENPPTSVPNVVDWWDSIFKKSTQLAGMGSGESSCYLSLLIPAKIKWQHLGQNHGWIHNCTACNTGVSWWSAVCWYPWRNTSTFIETCSSTFAQEHVVSAWWCLSPFWMPSAQLAWKQLSRQMDWAWKSIHLTFMCFRSEPLDFYVVVMISLI